MNAQNRLRALISILIFVAGCFMAGCAAEDPDAEAELSAIEEIRLRGKLTMLCFPTLGGGVSPNLEHGATRRVGTAEHFVGLEVTLMAKLADRLGVGLEVRTLPEPGYAPLIPALLEGEADIVASTLSITPEREKVVNFSVPYEFAYRVVVTRPDSEIQSVSDLRSRIAVTARGSSHYQFLKGLGLGDEQIRFVDFVEEYYSVILDGEAEFALIDSFFPDRIDEFQNAGSTDEFKVPFALPEEDRIAAAVPLGSDLKAEFDALIGELKWSGELDELRKEARDKRAEILRGKTSR